MQYTKMLIKQPQPLRSITFWILAPPSFLNRLQLSVLRRRCRQVHNHLHMALLLSLLASSKFPFIIASSPSPPHSPKALLCDRTNIDKPTSSFRTGINVPSSQPSSIAIAGPPRQSSKAIASASSSQPLPSRRLVRSSSCLMSLVLC